MEQHPTFEGGQDIRDRSFEYACQVVDFCKRLSEDGGVGRLMVPQLLNCSLSFATMLEEARSAESDADFISKCCIGLKEKPGNPGRGCAFVTAVESDPSRTWVRL